MIYQIYFYVPETHLEKVKKALFKNGAGKIGNYECCSWQTKGHGQFKPLPGSKPYLGKHNKLETVSEYKVEMICDKKNIKKVIETLKAAHPYEKPAYGVIELKNLA